MAASLEPTPDAPGAWATAMSVCRSRRAAAQRITAGSSALANPSSGSGLAGLSCRSCMPSAAPPATRPSPSVPWRSTAATPTAPDHVTREMARQLGGYAGAAHARTACRQPGLIHLYSTGATPTTASIVRPALVGP